MDNCGVCNNGGKQGDWAPGGWRHNWDCVAEASVGIAGKMPVSAHCHSIAYV